MNSNYGMVKHVMVAELGRLWNQSEKARCTDDSSQIEAQVWLWQHKTLFLAMGVLIVAGLLIASGMSA